MFPYKFRLTQASVSEPVLLTRRDHVQYLLAPHNAHGEHFWFASLVQFNLNNLLNE